MKTIKLTKISGEKSHSTSLGQGESIQGNIVDGSVFPKEPTVGKPFALDNYKTSIVEEIVSEDTFRTCNSVYKWENIK